MKKIKDKFDVLEQGSESYLDVCEKGSKRLGVLGEVYIYAWMAFGIVVLGIIMIPLFIIGSLPFFKSNDMGVDL